MLKKLVVLFALLAATSLGAHQEDELRDRLRSSLEGMAHSGFAFSVFVSQNGQPLIEQGYGWTDSAKKCTTTVHSLFNVASVTKSFTAIAIFQLHDSGKIAFNDTLGRYLADVPEDKQSITIQQLLTHTSGFQQNYSADGKKSRGEAVKAILADSLKFKPGSDFNYSNENFELLAAVIEVASGEDYERYIRKNILQKAGMGETKFWDEVDPRADCHVASMKAEDVPVAERNWGYIGSGGLYSSVFDLQRWFAALLSGKLLAASSLEKMWMPEWKGATTHIASGWFISGTDEDPEIWTRGSEDWGHNAVLRWFPKRKLLVIVETNSGELSDKNATANRLISDEILSALNQ